MPKAILAKVANLLYRTREETAALANPREHHMKALLFCAAATFMFAIFCTAFLRNMADWGTAVPSVPLPLSQWKVLYEGAAAPCPETRVSSPLCPAHPRNAALWQSALARDDRAGHLARVNARPRQEYWLGITIGRDQLARAAAAESGFLSVGLIRGSFSVWVDGEFLLKGAWTDFEHLSFPLPYSWFERASDRPLRVALRIVPDADVQPPADALSAGAHGGPGFMTKAAATSVRRYYSFWSMARPLLLYSVNGVLALVFFAVWWAARERQEYLYMAAFALSHASIHLRALNLFYLRFSPAFCSALELVNYVTFGVFGMLCGFSFARVRRSLFIAVVAAAALGTTATLLAVREPVARQLVANAFEARYSWLLIMLGGALCLFQAYYLWNESVEHEGVKRGHRVTRLALFGAGLATIALLSTLTTKSAMPTLSNILFAKGGPYFLIVFLATVAFKDYQAERLLVLKTPVSDFHRRPVLPEKINGTVLVVDLKASETLFRLGAKKGNAGEYVSNCLSSMWNAVLSENGLVLSTEGDALLALFERLDDPHRELESARRALRACDRIAGALAKFEIQLRDSGALGGDDAFPLRFRGGLVEGSVRPIWREVGGSRHAGWVEAGRTNPFVESARLLELERQVGESPAQDTSLNRVVLPAELATRLHESPSEIDPAHWGARAVSRTGKHGKTYLVSVYLPSAPTNS